MATTAYHAYVPFFLSFGSVILSALYSPFHLVLYLRCLYSWWAGVSLPC